MAESILTQVEDFHAADREQMTRGHGDTSLNPAEISTATKKKTSKGTGTKAGTKWVQVGDKDIKPFSLPLPLHEQAVVDAAFSIINAKLRTPGSFSCDSPELVRQYLVIKLALEQSEVFGVMFLDAQNILISFEIMFKGTIAQTAVYPREIVRRAIELNAANVILAHNHPSGSLTPSKGDEKLTTTLKCALSYIDVKVLDHIIIGGQKSMSMAERGML